MFVWGIKGKKVRLRAKNEDYARCEVNVKPKANLPFMCPYTGFMAANGDMWHRVGRSGE